MTTDVRLFPIVFESSDALSGIERYDILLDGSVVATVSAEEAGEPVCMPMRKSGTLTVRAIDRAGNSVSSAPKTIVFTGTRMPFSLGTVFAVLLAMLVLLAGANVYLLSQKRAPRRSHLQFHKQFDALKDLLADEMRALEDVHLHSELAVQKERIINRLRRLVDRYEAMIEKELE